MAKSWCLIPVLSLLTACNAGRVDKGKPLARIDGKNFTQTEFDNRLLSANRVEAVNQDPEERRKEFNRILRSRLGSLAALKSGLKLESLKQRLELMDQRVITQYYYESFLHNNGGHTPKQVEAYYNSHLEHFKNDSGKVLALTAVAQRVSDSLIISKANLDSFYQASTNEYRSKANCDFSLIQTRKRKEAENALKAIQSGLKFEDAAAKFSNHPSKSNRGFIGRINQGEVNYDLGASAPVESLFFDKTNRLKPGQVSKPISKDSNFILVRPDSCREENIPPLASIRQRVAEEYLRKFKTELNKNGAELLKKKYNVRLLTPTKTVTDTEIAAYYEKNKTNYESPETFDLYHIEMAQKEKLASKFQAVKDLTGFKNLANQMNENSWTKSASGYVGVVKRDYTLPYGIGLMPTLFSALDGMATGKVGPFQNADTRKWHFFWLVQKGPRKVKTLDRVRRLVKSDLEANRTLEVSPKDTLAVFGNSQVIRESDVLFLQEEIPPNVRPRYTRDNLVDYLIMWKLASEESKVLGLIETPQLIGSRLENEDAFWNKVYQDSIIVRHANEDTALLSKTFKEKRKLFSRDSSDTDWRTHTLDIAGYLRLTQQDFNLEFQTNPEKYNRDSVPTTMAQAETDLYFNLRDIGTKRQELKELERLKQKFKVKILDKSLDEPTLEPAGEFFKKAQGLHYDHRLDQALDLYEKLRLKYASNVDLQDSVSFGVAQIYIEQEKYQQALAEYRRVSLLFPKSPNDYKAMFMIGFIQSEHLKHDSDAVHAFEKMLTKHPKTDLSDDADWMIRNIRSGGKLMPVLEGDSGWVAPDTLKTDKEKKAAPKK